MLRGFFIVVPNSELRGLTVPAAEVVSFGFQNDRSLHETFSASAGSGTYPAISSSGATLPGHRLDWALRPCQT